MKWRAVDGKLLLDPGKKAVYSSYTLDSALSSIRESNPSALGGLFNTALFTAIENTQTPELADRAVGDVLNGLAAPEFDLGSSQAAQAAAKAHLGLLDRFASTYKECADLSMPHGLTRLLATLTLPTTERSVTVYDPSCGSGGFLIDAALQIRELQSAKQQNANQASAQVYGEETDPDLWSLARTNLLLHGIDDHRMERTDAIRQPGFIEANGLLRQFDIVVSKPPFGVDTWGYEMAEKDPYGRFDLGLPPKTRGDYAYILHMLAALKPGGRMAVVVPHGVLFRSANESAIRQRLVEENLLDAIIGLPKKLLHGASIPVAVMVFNKTKKDRDILFVDARELYTQRKSQNVLENIHIREIVENYHSREKSDISRWVSPEEIRANEFNLHIPRYIGMEAEPGLDFMELMEDRTRLMTKLNQLDIEINQCLDELKHVMPKISQ